MATLSNADKQNLNADQQAAVLKAKQDWEAANAAGDTAAMEKAHAAAEAVRASSSKGAYSGGTSGNAYTSLSNGNNTYMKSSTANGNASLSSADNALLNASQQQQIADLKAAWAQANAAGDQAAMDAAHQQAEAIRKTAGYTGGASGAGYGGLAAGQGGMTADQMALWLEDYKATNFNKNTGWTNGYSTAMNVRSKANKVRQQMLANEQAMANADQATKDYLHQQNLLLAELLPTESWYNEDKGRWETWEPNLGYGMNYNAYYNSKLDELEGVPGLTYLSHKKYYGYTDEEIDKWANDTSRYFNFVDQRVPYRNKVDESSGYTGQYAQFVNGPYAQLLGGGTHDGSVNPAVYENVSGDGFYDGVDDFGAPNLKGNNAMSDYTNQFTSYVQGGVIQPGILAARNPGATGDARGAYSHKTGYGVDASDPRYTGGINRDVAASTPEDPSNIAGQLAYYNNYGKYATSPSVTSGSSGSSGSAGGYSDYIDQMYAAALESQMAQLEASYNQNIADIENASGKVDDTYTEQKRQTTGTSEQQAAAWREMANAYGLNSGAIGQAALAQNNQLQSSLNTLESAQAAAQADLEQQRVLLGQQYQLQINQALADNDFNRAQALYQEAVRQDELLLQKQQLAIQTALQMAQMAMQQSQFNQSLALDYAKAGLNMGGTPVAASLSAPSAATPDYNDQVYVPADAGMSTAEFNDFTRAMKEYVSSNQGDRLDDLLRNNVDRLSNDQYLFVKNQLSKLG